MKITNEEKLVLVFLGAAVYTLMLIAFAVSGTAGIIRHNRGIGKTKPPASVFMQKLTAVLVFIASAFGAYFVISVVFSNMIGVYLLENFDIGAAAITFSGAACTAAVVSGLALSVFSFLSAGRSGRCGVIIALDILILFFSIAAVAASVPAFLFLYVMYVQGIIPLSLIAMFQLPAAVKRVEGKAGLFTERRSQGIIAAVLAVSCVCCLTVNIWADTHNKNARSSLFEPGTFSEFEMLSFDGKTYDQSVLEGCDYTFINCWATFCGPCEDEMPDLEVISREHPEIQVIGLCCDVFHDGAVDAKLLEKGQTVIDKTGVTYLNLIPSGEISAGVLDKVFAYPTSFVVDKDGNIVLEVAAKHTGAEWLVILEEYLND